MGTVELHVVHVLYSLGTGGMEKGVTTLVAHASSHVRHSVLCLTTSGAMAERLPASTPVVEMRKKPGNSPAFLWKLSRRLKALDADIVHTRNWGGLDGVIAARLCGHRAVVHGEHGWEMADVRGQNRRRCWARKLLSRWVTEYTCVSRDMERWLRVDLRLRRPITQIYNGVDTERFRPGPCSAELREQLGLPESAFVVGVVGRLDPIKDHPTLFRAFQWVRSGGLDARLLVVGSGPEEARLRALASDSMRLLGNRSDVPDLLRALDVFVLPSLNEGISNTILEAMASGKPVIATRVGGNPELVEDGRSGVLVDAGDARAIAEALAGYARSADTAQVHGEAARRRVVRRFSIRSMVRAYERVWSRVAAAGDDSASVQASSSLR